MMLRRLFSSAPVDKGIASVFALGKLNHVAIAVPKLDAAVERFEKGLCATVGNFQTLPEHGVKVAFVKLPNTNIELLEPYGESSPISNFFKKNADGGIHHICIEVKDINVAMQQVKKSGIRPLSAEPKIGAHGKPVVFLHPKDCNGVLVELEQE
ncbi:mitochondrial methylmalonyl-CoA epimerase [Andalucia godoyi]|uniref:Methylmalonyl-CoA epimerase, mitochondrial n=1 Tax=Andalucia godoyi TaxID=505711 RepID=A0A8K0AI17_ANDGO|nr:mitochondrial methylmalonyl-CoA epimerase [Andalucia godoyi]|eukprot:ANDGO_05125.mRNA.1 mitochondrial methylmalonyl-CoA epimerase